MQNRWIVLIISMTSLFLGVFIYLTTRSESIYITQLVSQLYDGVVLQFIQDLFQFTNIPYWVVYSLPDGLWMFALILIILLLWDFKLNKDSLLWIVMAITTGILFEVLQGLNMIKGTYDIADLLLISIGAILPLSFIFIKKRLCITD